LAQWTHFRMRNGTYFSFDSCALRQNDSAAQ
jgi:hypothetical protein